MAGRKRAVPKDVIFNIFKVHQKEIIDDRGRVAVPSSEIWLKIYKDKAINGKMSAKSVYTSALEWWQKIQNELADDYETSSSNKSIDVSYELTPSNSNLNSQSESSGVSPEGNESANNIKFSITLSSAMWETIKPVMQEYKRSNKNDKSHKIKTRPYYVLEPGLWTHVLAERIGKHRKNIICSLSFKRAKVYLNGKYYITVNGHCTTCNAQLIGSVSKEPKDEDENVKFRFNLTDFNAKRHTKSKTKNVRYAPVAANKLFKSKEKASVLQRKIIQEKGTKMFESSRGRTISANAIRAGQSRQRQLQKLVSTNPIESINYLKSSREFGSTIRMIGLSPFFVTYASPNQLALFKMYKQKNAYTKKTCDATGQLVHKIGMFFIENH